MENTKLLNPKVEEENELKGNLENVNFSQDNVGIEDEEIHGYPTLDKILNDIGYTSYHYLLIFGCCIFYFSQGAQIYSFNLLMPVFNVVLGLSETKHLILSSICYFGFAIGSIFTGMLSKSFNRKIPILFFISVYALFSIIVVLYQEFYWITICRFVIGFCAGILTSLKISNLLEYLPVYYREFTIGIVLCSYILGIIFYVLSFKLLMPNFNNFHQWKMILFVISIPCVVSAIFNMFTIRDSARILLNKDSFNDALTEIRRLLIYTKFQLKIGEEEQLKKEVVINKLKKIDFSMTHLFSNKFIQLTIVNILLMSITSATYVSNFFTLPLILYKKQKNHSELFLEIILSQLVAIPAIILASILSTLPLLGRKFTITICLLICVTITGLTSLLQSGVLVCSTLINFFIFGAYFLSKVYILESFPSKLRDQGMSIIYLTARIAEALSPSICELTFKWFDYGPIVYMGILCLIGAIASLLIPYETRDQAIDSKI